MNMMANTINLSNVCSPVSLTGNNNTERNFQNYPINRVRNQSTFSDFEKNIPNNHFFQ
jgi:hypothetical protein